MVLPKVLAREIGYEVPEQPHHLHVAVGLALKHPAGAHPIEVAVEVELEQIGGMVRWASRFMERGMPKAELMQIEGIHIGVDEANRILLGDVVIKRFGKEGQLIAAEAPNVVHDASRWTRTITRSIL